MKYLIYEQYGYDQSRPICIANSEETAKRYCKKFEQIGNYTEYRSIEEHEIVVECKYNDGDISYTIQPYLSLVDYNKLWIDFDGPFKIYITTNIDDIGTEKFFSHIKDKCENINNFILKNKNNPGVISLDDNYDPYLG